MMLKDFSQSWLTEGSVLDFTAFLNSVYHFVCYMLENDRNVVLPAFIIILVTELPFQLIIVIALMYRYINGHFGSNKRMPYYPKVSCLITCYNEGEDIYKTLNSLGEQIY